MELHFKLLPAHHICAYSRQITPRLRFVVCLFLTSLYILFFKGFFAILFLKFLVGFEV